MSTDANPAAAPMTEAEFNAEFDSMLANIEAAGLFTRNRDEASWVLGELRKARDTAKLLIREVQLLRSEAARAKESDRRLVLVRDAASSIADYAESQNRAMTAKLLGLVNDLTQDAFDSQPRAAGAEGPPPHAGIVPKP